MKKIIVVFFTGLAALPAFAQSPNSPAEREMIVRQIANLTPNSPGAPGFDDRYQGVEGTPYFEDNWLPGKVYLAGDKSLEEELVFRLDIHKQQLLLQLPSKQLNGVVGASNIRKVVLRKNPVDSAVFILKEAESLGDKKIYGLSFYEVLLEGPQTLLKSWRKTFRKADYQQPYSPDRRSDTYELETTMYYLVLPDGKVAAFKLKKKAIQKALPEWQKGLDKFKGDLETEAGLIAFLKTVQ